MFNAKSASLLAGLLQQTCLVLIIHYSKTRQHNDPNHQAYLTSVAVAAAEVFKMCLSYVLEVQTKKSSVDIEKSDADKSTGFVHMAISTLRKVLDVNNPESRQLIIPAAFYLAQNNLLFVALKNLSVPIYQVTNQGKLLTTAIISRILLKKQLSILQYFAVMVLGLGVAVIHLSEYLASSHDVTSEADQNHLLGLCAVLISCLTSAFSGVYFELILKSSKNTKSLHLKNFQLALWSLLLSTALIICKDGAKIMKHGVFQGFDVVVILVIVAQGMTGFVVSLMLKYADAILKGFAISIAAVVSTLASVIIFDTKLNTSFFLGSCMVAVAVKMYTFGGRDEAKQNLPTLMTSLGKKKKTMLYRRTFVQGIFILLLVFSSFLYYFHRSERTSLLGPVDFESLLQQNVITSLPNSLNGTISKESQNIQEVLQVPMKEQNSTTPEAESFPSCPKNESYPPLPSDGSITKEKYRRLQESVKVVSYIIEKLSMMHGEPMLSPMFGTLLRDHRNGTGPCLLYDLSDKDFDIAVAEPHFYDILMMGKEIEEKFGWKIEMVKARRLFFLLKPQAYFDARRKGTENFYHLRNPNSYQIDVYGFQMQNDGMIHFPWDLVSISAEMFLPLVKHKQTAPYNDDVNHDNLSSSQSDTSQYFYKPFNTPCILRNMYGEDYMTPLNFVKNKKTWTLNKYANDTSLCKNMNMTEYELSELERQKAAWTEEEGMKKRNQYFKLLEESNFEANSS